MTIAIRDSVFGYVGRCFEYFEYDVLVCTEAILNRFISLSLNLSLSTQNDVKNDKMIRLLSHCNTHSTVASVTYFEYLPHFLNISKENHVIFLLKFIFISF